MGSLKTFDDAKVTFFAETEMSFKTNSKLEGVFLTF